MTAKTTTTDLNPETVLQRAPSLALELGPNANIRVGDRRVPVGPNILPILQTFEQPIAFGTAVKSLSEKITGAQAWIELVSTIKTLYNSGILVGEGDADRKPMRGAGWSAPMVHISMLDDRVRTETFIRAIEATVQPGDVVIDIGTGTGVMATAAARAGARHVYAIEATEMGSTAKAVFAANGFADRITLVPGWSSQVELPERANVLVAEIIGSDPLAEGVLEAFADARKRFLTPDARIIPSRARVLGVPVTIDEEVLATHAFSADATGAWKKWYGIDFAPLLGSMLNKTLVFNIKPRLARDWPQLSSPIVLADLDLSGTKPPLVNESSEITIETPGLLGGLLVYFDLEVGPGERIVTSPAEADEKCSWTVMVWTSGTQRPVKRGDRFRVDYKYRVDSAGTRIELIKQNGDAS
jgi:protein arginine N-methyltransferase 1